MIEHRVAQEEDMKQTLVALTLTAAHVLCGGSATFAQTAQVARGTISAIGGQSLTVKVGGQDMTFTVDQHTTVIARGAGTKATRAVAAGKTGPHLSEILAAGQWVALRYTDVSGGLYATEIKSVPSAAAKSTSANGTMTSTGVVKSIGGDSIRISRRSGGGASFDQTFTIDSTTKLFVKGGATATASRGGKAPIGEFVTAGDRVTVSYHKQGSALLASAIHVAVKMTH